MNGHGSLNRIFRVVWNASLGVWQVASELAKGKGKTKSVKSSSRGFAALAAGSVLVLTHAGALAQLPTGGQVTAGSGTIGVPSNGNLVINQGSQNMAIDWQSFNVGQGNSVQFVQPNAQATALNRVLGGDPSVIRGSISANGRVVLLNPNGILFGPTSTIDVNAMLASTLNMSNEDFMAGKFNLEGSSKASIVNQGRIQTADGGFLALIAAKIENVGEINVRGGQVVMGAGQKVRLDLGGPIKIEIDEAIVEGYINNGGLIKAEGGTIVMTVKTAGELASYAINNTGHVDATSLVRGEGGSIRLQADGGTVVNSGTLKANAADGKGGTVEVLGNKVGILSGSTIEANGTSGGGTVLIGGDFQGKNPDVQNAELSFIEQNTRITANATDNGDGGKVIVWADGHTAFNGSIEAKGGANGGNGGFVEVSGKRTLDFKGTVDTTAAKGEDGTLLLDPTNLFIAKISSSDWITKVGTTFADYTTDPNPSSSHGISFLSVDTLVAALSSGNVTVLSACDVADCAGNITVLDAINWSGFSKLTLDAEGSVFINANLTSNRYLADALSVIARAGDVHVNANIDMSSISGGENSFTAGTISLSAANGRILIGSDVTIQSNGGTPRFNANYWGGNGGLIALTAGQGITLGSNSVVRARAGSGSNSLYLSGADGLIRLITSGAGSITQQSDSVLDTEGLRVTTQSGSITLTSGSNKIDKISAQSSTGNIAVSNAWDRQISIARVDGQNAFNTGDVGSIFVSARNISVEANLWAGSITLLADSGTQQSGNFVGISVGEYVEIGTSVDSITLTGRGGDGAANQHGIALAAGVKLGSDTGSITLNGYGGSAQNGSSHGIVLGGLALHDAGEIGAGGGVTLNAIGGTGGSGNHGLYAENRAIIGNYIPGAIVLDAQAGAGGSDFASDGSEIEIQGRGHAVTIKGSTFSNAGTPWAITTTGSLTLDGTRVTGDASLSNFLSGFSVNGSSASIAGVSSLTLTGPTGTDQLTVLDRVVNLGMGSVIASGYEISLEAALTANSLTINAGAGGVTQTSDLVDVSALNVTSSGDVELEGEDNKFGNVSVSAAGKTVSLSTQNYAMNVAGNLIASTIKLGAASITQTGPGITANAMSLRAYSGSITMSSANNVAALDAYTSNSGNLTFNNAGRGNDALTLGLGNDGSGLRIGGSITLTGLGDLNVVNEVNARDSINLQLLNARNVTLGSEIAGTFSLTQSEMQLFDARALSISTTGSVTSVADTTASQLSEITIAAGQGIKQSGSGRIGFTHVNNGVLTLIDTGTGDTHGIGNGSASPLVVAGVGELTLTSAAGISVDTRSQSSPGTAGSGVLSKLHITSTSAAANVGTFGVQASGLGLSLGRENTLPNWFEPVPKGRYTIALTNNVNATDVTFVGNAQIRTTAASNVGAGNLHIESAYSINVAHAITSTSGDITLKADSGLTGNYVGITVSGVNVTTGSGSITLSGKGGTGRGDSDNRGTVSDQHGVLLASGARVQATGTGTISITGQGGSGSIDNAGNHDGVVIQSSSAVSAAGGAIWMSGTGGSGSTTATDTSDGIVLATSSNLSNDSSNGVITLIGQGGSSRTASGTTYAAKAVVQSGAGVITTWGLELVSTSRGEIDLRNNNNVSVLAADVRHGLKFDNGGNSNVLTIGTVNGRAGFSATSAGTIGLYDLAGLAVNESLNMVSGTLELATNSITVAAGKTIGTPVGDADAAVGISVTSRAQADAVGTADIVLGGTSGATLDSFASQIRSKQVTFRTTGRTDIVGAVDFTEATTLSIFSNAGIFSAADGYLILSGANNDGTVNLNAGTVGTASNAIQLRGASRIAVASASDFNIASYTDDLNTATFNTIKSLDVTSNSNGANRVYQVTAQGLTFNLAGNGMEYHFSAIADSTATPVDITLTTSTSTRLNANSDLKGGNLKLNSGNAVMFNTDVSLNAENVEISSGSNLIFNTGAKIHASGKVDLTTRNTGYGITLFDASLIEADGSISLSSNTLSMASGSEILTGTDLLIAPITASRMIGLGDGAWGSDVLVLTQATLNRLTAQTLILGRNDLSSYSGNIQVGGTTGGATLTNIDKLVLRSYSGSVSQNRALTVANLEVALNTGTITLNHASNAMDTFKASTRGAIIFTNGKSLNLLGATSAGHGITIKAKDTFVVSGEVNSTYTSGHTNGGLISLEALDAGQLTIEAGVKSDGYSSGSSASHAGGSITLTGGNIGIANVTLSSRGSNNTSVGSVGGNAGIISINATAENGIVTLDGTSIDTSGGLGNESYGVGTGLVIDDGVVLGSLTGANSVRTVTISGGGGNVSLGSATGGVKGDASTSHSLLVTSIRGGKTATYGNVTLVGEAGGGGRALGAITFSDVKDVRLNAVTAQSLTISNTMGASGVTTFGGSVSTTGAAGINVTSKAITLTGSPTFTTTGGGNLKLSTQGSLTLANTSAYVSSGTLELIAGGGISISGSLLQTSGGAITLGSDVKLVEDDVTIDTTSGGTYATGGHIVFSGKLEANNNAAGLTIIAGSAGNVTFSGAVGGTEIGTLLGDVSIASANDVTVSQAFRAGSLTVSHSGVLTTAAAGDITLHRAFEQIGTGRNALAGDIVTANADISFAGAVEVAGSLIFNSGTGTGSISFSDALDSAIANDTNTLTLTSGSGGVVFGAAVGATGRLGNVVINSSADVTLPTSVSVLSLTTDAGGRTLMNTGTVITSLDNQTYNDQLALAGSVTLTSSNSGAIRFNNTIDGAAALAVNTSGVTFFNGIVGGETRLTSLTTDAGGSTTIAKDITTSGAQHYGDDVLVSDDLIVADLTLSSWEGGDITFDGTVNSVATGYHDLEVHTDGAVTFNKAVGATRALRSLKLSSDSGTTVLGGNVTTVDAQNYESRQVLINGDVSLTSTSGAIHTFSGTVDAAECALANLTVTASTFNKGIGLERALFTFNTVASNAAPNAVSTLWGERVVTLFSQNYGGGVVLGANTTLTSVLGGNISLNNTVQGSADGTQSLRVDTRGAVRFGGEIGGGDKRLSSIDAGIAGGGIITFDAGTIRTTGLQTYRTAGALSGDTVFEAATVAFNNGLNANGNSLGFVLSQNSTFDIANFGTVKNLTIGGAGTVTLGGEIETTGTQLYAANLVLDKDTTFKSTGALANGNITITGAVDGPHALTIVTGGSAALTGQIGQDEALASLSSRAASNTLSGSIETSGSQSFDAGVTLVGDATLIAGENIHFSSTVNGAFDLTLTVSGEAAFLGAVGNVSELARVDVSGDGVTVIRGGLVATTGDQTYDTDLELVADATLTSEEGDISIAGSVKGPHALIATAFGDITLSGPVGDADRLTSVALSGTTINLDGSSVFTKGGQTYSGAVELGGDVVLSSSEDGDIDVSGTIDGAHHLTINTGGKTFLRGMVGGERVLASLTTDAGGTLEINGGRITTTGNQTYNDAVNLTRGATFTSEESGAIVFNSTIDGGRGLTVNTGGETVFGGAIGLGDRLVSVTTDAEGTLTIRGTEVRTIGNQSFGDAITLENDVIFSSSNDGAITFGNHINGDHALTVSTGGDTTFNGAIGGEEEGELASLTITTGGTTYMNGGLIQTSGAQSYANGIEFSGGFYAKSNGGGDITFSDAINGAGGFEAATDGDIYFEGVIGGDIELGNFITDGAGTVYMNGGGVKTTGEQTIYNGKLVLGAATVFASINDGNISMNSVDGAHAFTITTDGTTRLSDNIGTDVELTSLTIDGAGAIQLIAGSIKTTGAQRYVGNVLVENQSTLESTGPAGMIAFEGTIDSSESGAGLTAIARLGSVVLKGNVGASEEMGFVALTAANIGIDASEVNTTSHQTYSGAVTVAQDITFASSDGGNVVFNDTLDGAHAVTVSTSGETRFNGEVGGDDVLASLATNAGGTVYLGADVTTDATQSYGGDLKLLGDVVLVSEDGGNISLGGAVDGTFGLTVTTTGNATFSGTVGEDEALASLAVNGGGSATLNGGVVNTVGEQTYNGAVVLGANTVLDSSDEGDIGFYGTVNGAHSLTINTGGTTTLAGVVGGGTALASLATDAAGTLDINAGVITTSGSQTYNDAVNLTRNATFVSNGAGAIAFNNTVNGTRTLTVNTQGATVFGGIVGGTQALASITTDAGGTLALNGGTVSTTGAQSYDDAMTLGANATLASSGSGDITFGSTINGEYSLTVNTAGQTAFNDRIGEDDALTSITTDAPGTVRVASTLVKTSGAQTFNEAMTLSANAQFTSATGNITFGSTVDGAYALGVETDGDIRFTGAVGGTAPLAGVTTSGDGKVQLAGGSVSTSGVQTYNNAVALEADAALTSANGGAITFGDAIDGAYALSTTTTGTTHLNGTVGQGHTLTALTVNGNASIAAGQIATTGVQHYTGNVLLRNDADLVSSGATGGITIDGSIDGDVANRGLLLSASQGEVVIGGDIGGAMPLGSLTISAEDIALKGASVTTSQSQDYTGAVTVAQDITFASTGGGDINFFDTLDGGYDVVVNATGATLFGDEVGGGTALASLTTNAGGTVSLAANVTTIGDQSYGDHVSLVGDAILASNDDGDITFGGKVNGDFDLTVDTSGDIAFNGAVGTDAALASLLITGSGSTTINGGAVTTSGAQTYGGALELGGDLNLVSTAGGAITFDATVDGAHTLSVATSDVVSFGGDVGGNAPLASLNITDAALVRLGADITAESGLRFDSAVELFDDVAITSTTGGALTFNGEIDGRYDLALSTDGAVNLNAEIGGNDALASLATSGNGSVNLNGGAITTAGDQSFSQDVQLSANTTLVSQDAGDIRFGGTVDGNHDLTVESAGSTTFAAAVGGETKLASLTTLGGGEVHLDGGLIRTNGQIEFDSAVWLGANTIVESRSNILFNDTVDGEFDLTVNTPANTTFGGAIGSQEAVANLYADRNIIGAGAGTMTIAGPSINLTGSLEIEDAVTVTGPTTVSVGGDALFWGNARQGRSLLDVTAGGRIVFGRGMDSLSNYLPTLFTVPRWNPPRGEYLFDPVVLVSGQLPGGATASSSYSNGYMTVVLSGGVNQSGAQQPVGNSDISYAVEELSEEELSNTVVHLLTIDGGVNVNYGTGGN